MQLQTFSLIMSEEQEVALWSKIAESISSMATLEPGSMTKASEPRLLGKKSVDERMDRIGEVTWGVPVIARNTYSHSPGIRH